MLINRNSGTLGANQVHRIMIIVTSAATQSMRKTTNASNRKKVQLLKKVRSLRKSMSKQVGKQRKQSR